MISDPSTVQDKKVFEDAASAVGAKVLWASVSESDQPGVHDPLKLAAAYKQVFKH